MRHARLTWKGAFHHVMNRGHNREAVFKDDYLKTKYLKIISEEAALMKIHIYCYCIMDNHFHMILQNSSGRLSDFMKRAHTRYGIFYRKMNGGKGYVFHDRFKSTVIQNESYLISAIIYVLQNPLRAKIVNDPYSYVWSSASLYFSNKKSFLDSKFVETLFVSKVNINNFIRKAASIKNNENNSKYGIVMGSPEFKHEASKFFDRRKNKIEKLNKREEDKYFEPIEKVYYEFEKRIGKTIEEIDTANYEGKRKRGEFLVLLRDLSGLKYSEIYEIDIFRDIRFSYLSKLYSETKKRLKKKKI